MDSDGRSHAEVERSIEIIVYDSIRVNHIVNLPKKEMNTLEISEDAPSTRPHATGPSSSMHLDTLTNQEETVYLYFRCI